MSSDHRQATATVFQLLQQTGCSKWCVAFRHSTNKDQITANHAASEIFEHHPNKISVIMCSAMNCVNVGELPLSFATSPHNVSAEVPPSLAWNFALPYEPALILISIRAKTDKASCSVWMFWRSWLSSTLPYSTCCTQNGDQAYTHNTRMHTHILHFNKYVH